MPDGQPATARVFGGRYRLVRVIAVGGMATVWEGHDEVLSRPIAVKVPHPHLAADPSYEARFRREAIAAARLSHPGIVATYDTGNDEGTSFIVMELVRGRTLRDVLADGPVPPAFAVAVVAQVAEALDVAHRGGLIHRDVKPANLLVIDEGALVPRIKVADFGVARAQDVLDRELTTGEATREGFVVGTARYLAPEQVAAKALDTRTDIYALGCVLYELLSGQPPFVRETDLGTALAHLQDTPAPLPPAIPTGLGVLVFECLAKDPAMRPQSAADLEQRLAQVAGSTAGMPPASLHTGTPTGGHTVVAPPPTAAMPVAMPAPTTDPSVAAAQAGRRPVAGTRPTARPSRSNAPLIVVVVLVVLAGLVGLAVLWRAGDQRPPAPAQSATTTSAVPASALRVDRVQAFDPEGDGEEGNASLRRLVDGKADTSWSTDRYRAHNFGGLKKGVGVVLVLESPATLRSLSISSPTKGYDVSIYVRDSPARTIDAWGAPVAQRAEIDGDETFALGAVRAQAVLVWCTDPGATFQLTINEIRVLA